jgi:hypothetical protein
MVAKARVITIAVMFAIGVILMGVLRWIECLLCNKADKITQVPHLVSLARN